MADSGDVLKAISDNVEKVFRHMLPGLCVLLASGASHHTWFKRVDFSNGWHLTTLAVIAIAVGNAWYVAHRYSLHQFIDFLSYRQAVSQPRKDYSDWLYDHIRKSFLAKQVLPSMSNHLYMRSSQTIFLFIASEIALVFVFGAECGSFFHRHPILICVPSVFGIAVAIRQQSLAFHIDMKFVNDPQNIPNALQQKP
jgi:hypothetical protein